METGIMHMHAYLLGGGYILFMAIKVFLLVSGKHDALDRFNNKTKVVRIIFDSLILISGIFLMFKAGDPFTDWLLLKYILFIAAIPLAVIAFKRKKSVLGIVSLLIFIYIFALSKTKDPLLRSAESQIEDVMDEEGDASPVAKGKVIYTQLCERCHGPQGNLGAAGAKDLSASQLSEADTRAIIINGKGMMPANELSDDQLDALMAYLETLKK